MLQRGGGKPNKQTPTIYMMRVLWSLIQSVLDALGWGLLSDELEVIIQEQWTPSRANYNFEDPIVSPLCKSSSILC